MVVATPHENNSVVSGSQVWSPNQLERVNEEPKRRTLVVGTFPNDAAIPRLVGAVLLEHDEHWQLGSLRMFSAESMASIAALEELLTQPSLKKHSLKQPRGPGPR